MKIGWHQSKSALLVCSILVIGLVIGAAVAAAGYRQHNVSAELEHKYRINVEIIGRHADGTIFYQYETHNIVTNAGVSFLQAQLSGTSASTPAKFIALTTNTTAPAYADTALTGEITDGGLARATGTYTAGTASNGDVTWTITHTFTASAAHTGVDKAGLLTANAAGTLFAETTFASVNLASSDTLSITWTVAATN